MRLPFYFTLFLLSQSLLVSAASRKTIIDPRVWIERSLSRVSVSRPFVHMEVGKHPDSFLWYKGEYGFLLDDQIILDEKTQTWHRKIQVFWFEKKKVKPVFLEWGRYHEFNTFFSTPILSFKSVFKNRSVSFVRKGTLDERRAVCFYQEQLETVEVGIPHCGRSF